MTIPAIYFLFMCNKGFWFSIAGIIIRNLLSLGYYAPTLLMFQNVLDDDVKNIAFGIFSLFIDLD